MKRNRRKKRQKPSILWRVREHGIIHEIVSIMEFFPQDEAALQARDRTCTFQVIGFDELKVC